MFSNKANPKLLILLQFLFVVLPMALYVVSEREWEVCGIISIIFASVFLIADIVWAIRQRHQ